MTDAAEKLPEPKPAKLTIEFPSQAYVESFASWMSNSGEQGYWDQLEIDGTLPSGIKFHYHGAEKEEFPRDDARRYGEFMADNTIRTTVEPDHD